MERRPGKTTPPDVYKRQILVCCVVIGMGAVPYFMITYNTPAPATGISMGCLTVVGLLLTVALTVITIRDIVRIVKKYREEGNA